MTRKGNNKGINGEPFSQATFQSEAYSKSSHHLAQCEPQNNDKPQFHKNVDDINNISFTDVLFIFCPLPGGTRECSYYMVIVLPFILKGRCLQYDDYRSCIS